MSAAQPFVLESTAASTATAKAGGGERDGGEREGGWPLCLQRFAEMAGRLSASAATQARSPTPRGA
jgi:hypothetical protein